MHQDREFWLGFDTSDPEELDQLSAIRDAIAAAFDAGDAAVRSEMARLRERLEWHYSSWHQLDALARSQAQLGGEPIHKQSEQELRRLYALGKILQRVEQIQRREVAGHIRVAFDTCNDELLRHLAAHPEDLYSVHPGTFEDIVARIFEGEGYEITRISSWNQPDGGVDFLAIKKVSSDIDIRLAVQCKRNARDNKVGVDPVRSLMGVLDVTKAHEGVLVTTGFFTRNVFDEVQRHYWRIALRDYQRMVSDLQSLGLIPSDQSGGGSASYPGNKVS